MGASNGEFKNLDDLLARYEALVNTRSDLGERQIKTWQLLEEAKSRMVKKGIERSKVQFRVVTEFFFYYSIFFPKATMLEENHFKILGHLNTFAHLNSRYQLAKNKTQHWESMVNAIKDECVDRMCEINQVKGSCWNIYLIMCKRKQELVKIPRWDVEEQFMYVKKTLNELSIVNDELVEMEVKNQRKSRKSQDKDHQDLV